MVTEKGLITFAASDRPDSPALPRRETNEAFFNATIRQYAN